EYLGVVPGSVTAFGAINDTANRVTFVLDADLMQHEIINCHATDHTDEVSRRILLINKALGLRGHRHGQPPRPKPPSEQ
ncbi:MAG: YbaK/EbsC family protein, partial [Thermomicrobium sp.]